MKLILIVLAFLLVIGTSRAQTPPIQKQKPQTSERQTPPAPVVSPEVHADLRVTFRLRAPNVKEVSVQIKCASKPLAMQKDDKCVCSGTTYPLHPAYYGATCYVATVTLLYLSTITTSPYY